MFASLKGSSSLRTDEQSVHDGSESAEQPGEVEGGVSEIVIQDLKEAFGTDFQIDKGLIDAILQRNCIAFVGAGFSQMETKMTWDDLVQNLLVRMPFLPYMMNLLVEFASKETSAVFTHPFSRPQRLLQDMFQKKAEEQVKDAEGKGPQEQDAASMMLQKAKYLQDFRGEITTKQLAQEIEDGLGTAVFNDEVAKLTKLSGDTVLHDATRKRLSYLARIPFRAIVTTNYNNLCVKNITPQSLFENAVINQCRLDGDMESAGEATTAISKGALNPQHNFERILRPGPGMFPALFFSMMLF
jgi:flavodoxin